MDKLMNLMDMTWPEVHQAIADQRILIFCVGAIEQHGYHLPLGVDVYLPMEIAARVAREVDGVLAPCTNYGYKSLLRSGGGPHFIGSVGIRGATLVALVKDLMEQFIKQGWKRIVVLDWHIENVPFVYEGIDEALQGIEIDRNLKIVRIDNPNALGVNVRPGLEEELFGKDFPGWAVEHAAIWETSAMLAAYPELVREHEIVDGHPPEPFDYDIFPIPKEAASETGTYWKATLSSKEKGEQILKATAEGIIDVLKKEFNL